MADYIYMMETRLTPEQQRAVTIVQEAARAHEVNVFLVGGALRDMTSGSMIRDLDFGVQGNPFKLQKDLEKAGVIVEGSDEELKILYLVLPGNVRGEIAMLRTEKYDKPGKPPQIAPATINEDLRRRDFTVNAMGLSLNPGSRGLLHDPANGVADIEARQLRILHNYSFLEEPSRLIRATRLMARFHWTLEERTQARYNAAVENGYIDHVASDAVGRELEQIAHEDDPVAVLRALDKEGWLKVLNSHWTLSKIDTAGLQALSKAREQLANLGYTVDTSPAVMYFLTRRLDTRDINSIQKNIPRSNFVQRWKSLEDDAKELAKQLTGKEAGMPSGAWKLLSKARPDLIAFLEVTSRQQAVTQKIKNFIGKWRQLRERLPFPEMAELHITPQLPEYQKLMDEAFLLLLDGKLRSRNEILKFLKPYAPPPPPPPPPPKRGRGAKEAAPAPAAAAPAPAAEAGKRGRKAKAEAPAPEAKPTAKAEAKPAPAKAQPKKPEPKKAKPVKKAVKKAPAKKAAKKKR